MPEYKYTVTEHDLEQPWLVLGRNHGTVMLPDEENFFDWARENWPPPQWSVQLDPWQLSPRA